jgi:hypothetical protein
VQIFVVKSFVLKKKRECEREEKEGGTREGYRHKLCNASTSLVPCNPSWQGLVHVYMKDANVAGTKAGVLVWVQI